MTKCKLCNKEKGIRNKLFCSRKCFYEYMKKYPNEGNFPIGHKKSRGKLHAFWKGDNVGYVALHEWVRSRLGTPKKCEICGTETAKKFEWANISGKYKRDLTDWKRLCTPCHVRQDNNAIRMWETRNKEKGLILQILNNKIIKKYQSQKEIIEQTGLHQGQLSKVLNGKGHTCGGYI